MGCNPPRFGAGPARGTALQRELRDEGVHRIRFFRESVNGCGAFLDHGRILLRALIHLLDGRVDLPNARRLLLGTYGNVRDQAADFVDTRDDATQGLPC